MGKHDVRILFNAKTPMNTPPEEEGQQNEEEGGIDENFQ